MPRLIIVRGYPGSGCTTLAQELRQSGTVISIEASCPTPGENQDVFTSLAMGKAMASVDKRVAEAIADQVDPIVVDVHGVRLWELRSVVEEAVKAGYQVDIKQPPTRWASDPTECATRTHTPLKKSTWRWIVETWEMPATVARISTSHSPDELLNQARWLASENAPPKQRAETDRFLLDNYKDEVAELSRSGFLGHRQQSKDRQESFRIRMAAQNQQPPRLVEIPFGRPDVEPGHSSSTTAVAPSPAPAASDSETKQSRKAPDFDGP